jgi:uncharacterized protein (TIGR02996 family)
MSDNDALFRAILANPDDDAPRLVYADWLDEHGDPDRAMFIRAQVQLARRTAGPGEHRKLRALGRKLLRTNRNAWTAHLPAWARDPVFRRGFVERITCPVDTYLGRADELRRRTPLTGVRLTGSGDLAVPLFRSRTLDGLHFIALSCPWAEFPIRAGTWDHLVACPFLSRLVELQLHGHGETGTELVGALISANQMPELRGLTLRFLGLTDLDVARLVGHPWIARLTTLDLSDNLIGEGGVRDLIESPHLDGLKTLELQGIPIHDARMIYRLMERFGSRLSRRLGTRWAL